MGADREELLGVVRGYEGIGSAGSRAIEVQRDSLPANRQIESR